MEFKSYKALDRWLDAQIASAEIEINLSKSGLLLHPLTKQRYLGILRTRDALGERWTHTLTIQQVGNSGLTPNRHIVRIFQRDDEKQPLDTIKTRSQVHIQTTAPTVFLAAKAMHAQVEIVLQAFAEKLAATNH